MQLFISVSIKIWLHLFHKVADTRPLIVFEHHGLKVNIINERRR